MTRRLSWPVLLLTALVVVALALPPGAASATHPCRVGEPCCEPYEPCPPPPPCETLPWCLPIFQKLCWYFPELCTPPPPCDISCIVGWICNPCPYPGLLPEVVPS